MIRDWIIRLGFLAAVLGFVISLILHLATFAGLGWAQVDIPGLWLLFLVYYGFIFVAGLTAMSTHPVWAFPRGTPWWTRTQQTFALRPLWANLLHLLTFLILIYWIWWAVAFDVLHSISPMWLYLSLMMALALGEYGLGWWNRWVAERGGAQP
jgi:hypothetical protein